MSENSQLRFNKITVRFNEPFPHREFLGLVPVRGLEVTDRMTALGIKGMTIYFDRAVLQLENGTTMEAPLFVGHWLAEGRER